MRSFILKATQKKRQEGQIYRFSKDGMLLYPSSLLKKNGLISNYFNLIMYIEILIFGRLEC